MKHVIVIDLDSTLFPFVKAFAKVAHDLHGVTCPLDPDEWNALIADFVDPAVAIATFPKAYDHDMIEFNEPYEGAIDGLKSLIAAGYEIAYYTDRPAESAEATQAWLDYWGFPEAELHVCYDKRAEILGRKDILSIVDDRPRTLIWAKYELGLENVFSLRHGYNKNLIDIPGVNLAPTWSELTPLILEKLPIPA